jgi:betaine-aldehyde dehydrogenase
MPPWAGFKASGIGREAGHEGFDPFTELRFIGAPDPLAASLGRT